MSTSTPTSQSTCPSPNQPLSTMGPADELLDPRRRDLIARLSRYMENPETDSIGWACLWFADLSTMEDLIKACEQNPPTVSRHISAALKKNDQRAQAIRAWASARSSEDSGEPSADEESDTEEPPTKKRRLTSDPCRAKELCEERDDEKCVLTGCTVPVEVVHIIPRSLGKGEEGLSDFWEALECYWSPENVSAWKEQVLDPDGADTCSNLMCLVNVARRLWELAVFALKPLSLSEDKRQLEVQFYWLPMNRYRQTMPVTAIPSPFPHNLSSTNAGYTTVLCNIVTRSRISSGDIFTFKTDDPVGHPLPSMQLLDMQWILTRVLALSGAAWVTEEEKDQ
ncbi:hypothetical protein CBS147343_5179 [Aspergillus niger]|nr:hypothetical protein CBS147344_2557 [Aspergillus niger]KAI3072844.1 hypothetical protein CBS147343_5179 [Aspergillus niger]GKZ92483.1 hypothetical protein AnigIFM59636_005215 [Aspergillus niger]